MWACHIGADQVVLSVKSGKKIPPLPHPVAVTVDVGLVLGDYTDTSVSEILDPCRQSQDAVLDHVLLRHALTGPTLELAQYDLFLVHPIALMRWLILP
jgi:hypothetical protein